MRLKDADNGNSLCRNVRVTPLPMVPIWHERRLPGVYRSSERD